MRNAISELRVSGFVWPPQQKEEEMQPVKKSFQEQLRTVKEDPPSPPAVQVVPPKKTEELSVDQLLERWMAAKTNFAKALADVGAAEDSVEEAQALLAAERNSLMSAETRLITLWEYLKTHQLSPQGPEGHPPEVFWVHDAPDGLFWSGRYTSSEEAEEIGRSICTCNFSVRRMRVPKAHEFFPPAGVICDLARENAEENEDVGDETIGGFALVSEEAAQELNELISNWADKHFKVGFSVFDGELRRVVQNSNKDDVQLGLFVAAEGKTDAQQND
jgi:hypothetical protein